VQFDFQFADVGDHVEVIAGALDLGVDPRPGTGFHEFDGVVEGATGDTGVDGGLNQLRDGALGIGLSLIFQLSTTSSASTGTLFSSTVPLAVVRWPKPDQSSTMRSPGVRRRRPALACRRH
jgi:hypothetical protein